MKTWFRRGRGLANEPGFRGDNNCLIFGVNLMLAIPIMTAVKGGTNA